MGETVDYRELYEKSRQRKVELLVQAALAGDEMERYRILMLEQERDELAPEDQKADEESEV